MRTFAKSMEALQLFPQSDLRNQVIAHAQIMQPYIHDGEDGDSNWYLACLDEWVKDIQSDKPWRRERAQGIIELLKRVQDHLMVGTSLDWELAKLNGEDVGPRPRFSDGSILDLSHPLREEEKEIVPTIDFVYDETWIGGESDGEEGNYDGAGDIVQIPVSMIEETDEKTAFERFTGRQRSHIVHWRCEESEVYGNGKTQGQIDHLKRWFEVGVDEHRKACWVCSEWADRTERKS